MTSKPTNQQCFRSGVLWGASATAIATGLLFGKERNWALVALGGLGIYMAQGGKLSAEALPKELPNLPTKEELRDRLPFAARGAINGFLRGGPKC